MSQENDELALRRLVTRYAQCCDQRDGNGFAALYTPDAVLEGPGDIKSASPDAIRAVPGFLNIFLKTYHTVLNTTFEISGDTAVGEIYSMAHHLTPIQGGKYNDIIMYITYRDKYARTGGEWKFKHRVVVMEFNENRTVENIGIMPPL